VISKRFAKAVVTVVALTAAVLGLSASPAVADGDISKRAYVHEDEWWSDEGNLNMSHNAYTNATCLWQKILWADDYLDNAGIDGIFGDDTAAATMRWKRDNGLNKDTQVGVRAFELAGSLIYVDSSGGLRYDGLVHDPVITINGAGQFGFYDDGVHRLASYNYRTCS
jgi:peptidoglycan hydrolase-like protein with peptidoglycan-binding domain